MTVRAWRCMDCGYEPIGRAHPGPTCPECRGDHRWEPIEADAPGLPLLTMRAAHLAVEWVKAYPAEALRLLIDTGQLEQVGFGGCKHYCEGGEWDDDGEYWEHEPVLSIETTEGLNHDHPIWPVYRLAATSEEPGDG